MSAESEDIHAQKSVCGDLARRCTLMDQIRKTGYSLCLRRGNGRLAHFLFSAFLTDFSIAANPFSPNKLESNADCKITKREVINFIWNQRRVKVM